MRNFIISRILDLAYYGASWLTNPSFDVKLHRCTQRNALLQFVPRHGKTNPGTVTPTAGGDNGGEKAKDGDAPGGAGKNGREGETANGVAAAGGNQAGREGPEAARLGAAPDRKSVV